MKLDMNPSVIELSSREHTVLTDKLTVDFVSDPQCKEILDNNTVSEIHIDKDTYGLSDAEEDTLYLVLFTLTEFQKPSKNLRRKLASIVENHYHIIEQEHFQDEDGEKVYYSNFIVNIPLQQVRQFII
jgi:hypothetical protein